MSNTLTNITDKILARGLMTLREAAVMPRLTSIDYQGEAAQYGTTIDVPTPVSQAVSTVVASHSPKAPASKQPGLIQVRMDQWKTTDFHMTDKDMVEVDRNRHFMPMQTQEAARALANDIDSYIHGLYKTVYGYVGTAGVAPFSTVATATQARKVLNTQLAPMNDRRLVLDPTAEAQALQLTAYNDISASGDRAVKIEGELGRKFGFDHFMSQNVVTHTAGTQVSAQVASTTAAGASTIQLKSAASAGGGKTIVFGDVFTIAGDSQTYVYNSSATITMASTLTTKTAVTISPGLAAQATANSVVQFKRSHVVNLAFQRNAFVYVTRALDDKTAGLLGGNVSRALTDDVTGLTLRLEVVRQHKQVAWQFDVLYGGKLVRPEFAARVAG